MNEKENIMQKIRNLISQLTCVSSPYGDWKNLKQLDTGEYTEEEMTEYRQGRANIRAKINELYNELDNLPEISDEGEAESEYSELNGMLNPQTEEVTEVTEEQTEEQ